MQAVSSRASSVRQPPLRTDVFFAPLSSSGMTAGRLWCLAGHALARESEGSADGHVSLALSYPGAGCLWRRQCSSLACRKAAVLLEHTDLLGEQERVTGRCRLHANAGENGCWRWSRQCCASDMQWLISRAGVVT